MEGRMGITLWLLQGPKRAMQFSGRLLIRSLSSSSAIIITSSSSSSSTLQQIATTRKGVAKVILKKGKTQLFRDGSPMVYSGAVDRIVGRPPPKTGDVVLVADGTEKPIGWGLYNSVSMFCVRLMQLEEEAARDPSSALDMEKLLETRIDAATELRKNLGLPCAHTNAFRLVNSEGDRINLASRLWVSAFIHMDRLSGLIVDVFGDLAVIASSAAWVEKYKPEIEYFISRINGINGIKWRPSVDMLKEEGLEVSDPSDPPLLPSPGMVKVIENGISYAISLEGQKTGFYADQRENRRFISSISEGQKVLDLCCYSGGFALNASRGGAVNVIGIDTSLPALELAQENMLLNNLDPGKISFLREDATQFMKNAVSSHESWDLVILDPPKLAPRRKVLQNASGMYRNLNSLAMRVTKKGGLLMTCSCSGAMTQSGTFLHVLQGAASMAGRKVTVVRQAAAGCDHPIDPSYPEGAYLSNVLLRVL
ncbi:hypothetical protein GIB67_035245 [Kingdonia uniflora]|uniref:PUA domain-containing protein n=1 Tax=Kingdonia uniflora TaxID=39325 RepID=A0A7J7KY21_9MAGN|nr:hypothetical protein GIB67_035245 [Kingdonia uniflora]